MVNRRQRRVAGKLLADFFAGEITNDEYDNEFPSASGDAALKVVYWRIWFYYSDLHTHTLDHQDLSKDDIALFKRCIDFLKTDLEYEGPPIRAGLPVARLFRRLLGGPRPQSIFGSKSVEDAVFFTDWWPFASAEQIANASQQTTDCS